MTAVAERSTERLYTVEGVRRLIAPYVAKTAIEHYGVMGSGNTVMQKMESHQLTGSFKFRGGLGTILEKQKPIVTASAANYGAGVSMAGRVLDVPTTVVLPKGTAQPRIDNVARGNAEIIVVNGDFGDALRVARSMDGREMSFSSAYDDGIVIAAHGSAFAELLEQYPGMDTAFIQVGGAGELAGALMAREEAGSDVKIVAVQLEGNDSLERSLAAGTVQDASNVNARVCEGSAVRRIGDSNLALIQELGYNLEIITVGIADIGRELVYVDRQRQTLLADLGAAAFDHFPEPTGIMGVAGARVYAEAHPEIHGGQWGTIITGSNVDPARELIATSAYHEQVKHDYLKALK